MQTSCRILPLCPYSILTMENNQIIRELVCYEMAHQNEYERLNMLLPRSHSFQLVWEIQYYDMGNYLANSLSKVV